MVVDLFCGSPCTTYLQWWTYALFSLCRMVSVRTHGSPEPIWSRWSLCSSICSLFSGLLASPLCAGPFSFPLWTFFFFYLVCCPYLLQSCTSQSEPILEVESLFTIVILLLGLISASQCMCFIFPFSLFRNVFVHILDQLVAGTIALSLSFVRMDSFFIVQ